MVAAMLGILAVVGNSIRLLEDMTGNVEVAQRRAENLSNSQREMLRLLLAVTELAGAEQATDAMRTPSSCGAACSRGSSTSPYALFPPGSPEAREGEAIKAQTAALDWAATTTPTLDKARIRKLITALAAVEKRVKALYDGQTRLFYTATRHSLRAKEQGEWPSAARGAGRGAGLRMDRHHPPARGGRGGPDQRAPVPDARAADVRPDRGHRQGRRVQLHQPGSGVDPGLPAGGVHREQPARPDASGRPAVAAGRRRHAPS
jgi:hypothetical protein